MNTSSTDNAAAAPAAAFWTDLEQALGAQGFARGADAIPEKYWTDWSGTPPVPPLALLRPRSTEEVSALLRVCHAHRVPVVPQGGLTGLAGAVSTARPPLDDETMRRHLVETGRRVLGLC